MRRLLGLVLAAGLLLPATGRAWTDDGHRVVATIAAALLPPEKAGQLDALLRDAGIGAGMAEAATYPDNVLRTGPDGPRFAPWHFLTWPTRLAEPAADTCVPGCVAETLIAQARLGRAADIAPAQRALALTWVIHLVGDLHQPLHTGDRDDRGGNSFRILAEPPSNLHRVWDDLLVRRLAAGRSHVALARDLRGDVTSWRGHPFAEGTPWDWVRETHALVEPYAYDGIEPGGPVPEPYVERALPIVERQLLRAGIRLARMIEENF